MASTPTDGSELPHHLTSATSPASFAPSRSRRSSRASSLLRPRSGSSSSISSSSSQPTSPAHGGRSSPASPSSLFMPSFTSAYHAQGHGSGYMHSALRSGSSVSVVPVIEEATVTTDFASEVDPPVSFPSEEQEADEDSLSESDAESAGSTIPPISRQVSIDDSVDLAQQESIESSTDSLTTLGSTASAVISNVSNLSIASSASAASPNAAPGRVVPQLATTKFTSLSHQHSQSQSSAATSNATPRHGLSSLLRTSSSSHRNASAVSIVLDSSATASSSSKSRHNKLRKKASATSLASLTRKSKPGAVGSLSTAGSFGPLPREHSGHSKSRFFFLPPKHSAPPPPPPPPILTGGPRPPPHHTKVIPSDSGAAAVAAAAGGGSSGSSSGSSTASLNTAPSNTLAQNSLANSSQQTLFVPTSKHHINGESTGGDKPRKSPISPLDGRPSLSLDVRRLSINSQPSPAPSYTYASTTTLVAPTDKIHKHHLLLRPRKDSHPGTILSSSSSNSKLTSDAGSIYSFNPASPAYAPYAPYGLQKSISGLDVKTMSYKDINKIGEQALEDVWPFLCARVTPLFAGDSLRVPVEDLNKLVLLHTKRRISERDPATLINEVRDLLRLGLSAFDPAPQVQSLTDNVLVEHVADLWQFFNIAVLPYIQAVFVPLQLEFEGIGSVMTPEQASKFWERQKVQSVRFNNIKVMALISFRDWIVLPLYMRLKTAFSAESSFLPLDAWPRLLQCMTRLSSIDSGDEKQQRINELATLVRRLWVDSRSQHR
ncbi:HbrB-like-domain-containing protein [Lipomyces kononenkoae]|uniref:HbrB-like-domain-containing protein n=1 Tax=Lipomyces kononenkoae TaxID=34357 RepID=A0ACC3T839_LIPKO